jgi:hypothetical protein
MTHSHSKPSPVEPDTQPEECDSPPAAQKGAQLILEIRSNGARYVCSANRSACARTSDHELERSVAPGQ